MSNLNPNTIENVSITEVKELDEFLKSYNKHSGLSDAERKQQVLTECLGKVTEKSYDKLLEKSKTYTLSGDVPTETEWGQVRAVYREIGNKKIAESKDSFEKLSKEYSGTPSIEDELYGKLTPKQVVENLSHSEKKVETIKTLKVVASIVAGVIGFVVMTILTKLLISLFGNISNIIVQLIAGVLSIGGLVVCAWLANKLMGAIQVSAKKDRDKAEITEANHHDEIVVLQMAIKTAEENIKRVETQYGVEIFAQSDFSNLVKPAKKEKKVKNVIAKETLIEAAQTDNESGETTAEKIEKQDMKNDKEVNSVAKETPNEKEQQKDLKEEGKEEKVEKKPEEAPKKIKKESKTAKKTTKPAKSDAN